MHKVLFLNCCRGYWSRTGWVGRQHIPDVLLQLCRKLVEDEDYFLHPQDLVLSSSKAHNPPSSEPKVEPEVRKQLA